MYEKKYFLYYYFGYHSTIVEVSDKGFYDVINDLSLEFEIIKKHGRGNSVHYSILNYVGDVHSVGFIEILKKGDC